MTQLTIYDFIDETEYTLKATTSHNEYHLNAYGFVHVKTHTLIMDHKLNNYSTMAKLVYEVNLYKCPESTKHMLTDFNFNHVKFENLNHSELYAFYMTDNPNEHAKTLLNILYGYGVHPDEV